MHKEDLVQKLDERRSWACNDCRTFLFAKSQTAWKAHEHWLGGGNMAKPLILFAFWDVMAGVFAHSVDADANLIWTSEQDKEVEDVSLRVAELFKSKKANVPSVSQLRLLRPKVGDIISAEKTLKVFLEHFQDYTILGVAPNYFAHSIRPHYRNKLAHMYSPKLNGGTYSFQPVPVFFDQLMHYVATMPSPVVRQEQGSDRIDGVAMLRDSEKLASALTKTIRESFTEDQAYSALHWLGLVDLQQQEP